MSKAKQQHNKRILGELAIGFLLLNSSTAIALIYFGGLDWLATLLGMVCFWIFFLGILCFVDSSSKYVNDQ